MGPFVPQAQLATGAIAIDGFTRITAHVYRQGHGPTNQGYVPTGDDWSAPVVGVYYNDPPATAGNLAISEVNFNPHDPTEAEEAAGFDNNDDFEFIELVNIGETNVVLTGAKLVTVDYEGEVEGVEFDFSDSPITTLAPQQRILVVEDLDAFEFRYGQDLPMAGQWEGALSNNREMISLRAYDGSVIQQFSYNDSGSWPARPDGNGSSLEVLDLRGDYDDPSNWRASVDFGGSPGRVGSLPIGVVVNEILAHTDPPATPPDSIELLNTTSQPIDISGWYLSDSGQEWLKFRIPEATILQPGEYVVYDEDDFNPTPLNPGPNDFALSSARGDDVWLVIPDGNGGVRLFVDEVHFPATPNGESMGRVPDGSGALAPMQQTTLGSENAAPRVGPVVISELNYNPGTPSDDALAIDSAITSDDLEYVEIVNPTAGIIDLTEWRLRGGVDYDFATGTLLPRGARLVVLPFNPDKPENVNRLAAFRVHYGIDNSVRLVGGYAGHLNDLGETIRLQRPDEPPAEDPQLIPRLLEDEITYDVVTPWPEANGSGLALTRVSSAAFGRLASSWKAAAPSPGAHEVDGDINGDGQINAEDIDLVCDGILRADPQFDLNSDGVVDRLDLDWLVRSILRTTAGDANVDGSFDSTDLVQVFQAGEYEDGVPANSSWSEGDWNCDLEFDSSDLVAAFQAGSYERAARPARGVDVVPHRAEMGEMPLRTSAKINRGDAKAQSKRSEVCFSPRLPLHLCASAVHPSSRHKRSFGIHRPIQFLSLLDDCVNGLM